MIYGKFINQYSEDHVQDKDFFTISILIGPGRVGFMLVVLCLGFYVIAEAE